MFTPDTGTLLKETQTAILEELGLDPLPPLPVPTAQPSAQDDELMKPEDTEDPLIALAARIDAAEIRPAIPPAEFIIDKQYQGRVLGEHGAVVDTLAYKIEHGTVMEPITLAKFNDVLYLANGFHRCAAMFKRHKGSYDWVIRARIVPVDSTNEIPIIGHILNTREQLRTTIEDKRESFKRIVSIGYHRKGDGSFIGWRALGRSVSVDYKTIQTWMFSDFSEEYDIIGAEEKLRKEAKQAKDENKRPFDYQTYRERRRLQDRNQAEHAVELSIKAHLVSCEKLCQLTNNDFNRDLIRGAALTASKVKEKFKCNQREREKEIEKLTDKLAGRKTKTTNR